MKSYVKIALGAAALSFGAAAQVSAANVDGPSVFWKISVWGKPRALTVDMDHLAKRLASENG